MMSPNDIVSFQPLTVPTEPVMGYAWRWRTLEAVSCVWFEDGQRLTHTVPADYETDGPSFPVLARPLLTNVEWAASVLHDDDYGTRSRGAGLRVSLAEKWRVDWRFRVRLAYTRRHWGLGRIRLALYAFKHDVLVWPTVLIGGLYRWLT